MTEYEQRRGFLIHALESYRDGPEVPLRRYIDRIMRRSLKSARNEPEGKRFHNLIVLRYISSKKRAKQPICDALHIGRENYDIMTDHAIDRLLTLAFGISGIDWDAPLTDYRGRKQARGQAREMPSTAPLADASEQAVIGQITELLRLKYDLAAELLAGMERHIREDKELSEDIRGGILKAVKTNQARLILNAACDPLLADYLFPRLGNFEYCNT